MRSSAIATHKLIRILLVVAVVVMGGAVLAMTEVQKATDAGSFGEYASVRDFRDATLMMARAFDEANAHGNAVSGEIETAERAVALTTARVKSNLDRRSDSERGLVKVQIEAAAALAELPVQVVTQRGQPGIR